MVVTCLKAVELGAGAAATRYDMRLPRNGLLTAVEAPLLIMEVCIAATIVRTVASKGLLRAEAFRNLASISHQSAAALNEF